MNRIIRALLVLTVVLVTACSAPTATHTPAPPIAVSHKSGTMRISLGGTANVKDVPSLMAFDALREQGYTVEVISFAKTSLIPPALDKGDIEVSDANVTLVWAAAAQGADIRTIVGKVNTSFLLVSTKDINDCRDLDGKALTFATRQSVGYVMFQQHVARNCPGIKNDVILISDSPSRVAALQAGQVAAAYCDLEEWLQLQRTAPDKYQVLINFAQEFPQVCFLTFSVRREWAQQNPTMVQDFVRALLASYRNVIASPELLRDGIAKYLSIEPARAQELADAYLAAKIWDPNGGITADKVAYTLQFLRDGGILSADFKVEDVADLSYLNAVLADMGRQ